MVAPYFLLLFGFELLDNLVGIDRCAGNQYALDGSVHRPASQRHSANYPQRQQDQWYPFVIDHLDILDDLADHQQHGD